MPTNRFKLPPDPNLTLPRIAAMASRDPHAALRDARAAVRDLPDERRAYRLLAAALRGIGDVTEAERHELRAVELGLRDPVVVRAEQSIAADQLEAAERTIRSYLRANADDGGAVHILGRIAERRGMMREAESLFRRAVSFAPAYADAQLSLAGLLNRTGRTQGALAAADAVLQREPKHLMALSFKAGMLVQHRRLDAADTVFRTLTLHHPDDARGWMHYGNLLKTSGRIDDAAAAYRRSLAIAPDRGIAWWSLANLKSVRLDTADVAAMRAALAATADDDNRIHLHFALGKAIGDLGDHAAAFEQLRAGNALRLSRAPHDADGVSATFRQAEALFTPAFLAARAGSGATAPDPIFIVGMPRSGSTLIEQILASHPLVEGTEELHDLHRIAQEIIPSRDGGSYLDGIAPLSPARLRELGERYLQDTRRHRVTDRPFFTDKMPSNWLYTGLIRLILPNARIVDVRRHPMACGFANFAQHYNWGNNFAYDLTGIGRFYNDYVRHMAHFDRAAPGRVHRVQYETLVDDLEGEVRRLLDYLDLPFDPACLRFHETARAVHTPSAGQVRRPINRDGVDRWRVYEPWLEPLKQALGPVLNDYPASQPTGT